MKTILLTDGEFTGMIKSLRSLPEPVHIVGFVSTEHAAHVTMLDSFYVAPSWRDAGYLPYLLDVVRKENVDLIFPVVTASLEFMAEHAEEIREKTGAVLISSPAGAIHIANNKALLFDAVSKAGNMTLSCTDPGTGSVTVEKTDLRAAVTEFRTAKTAGELRKAVQYFTGRGIRCISKPVCGENAEGFMRFVSGEEFALRRLRGEASQLASIGMFDCMADEDLLPEERLIMPFLPGDEWDVDVLVKDGEVIASTVRKNLEMFGGLSACTVTVDDRRLLDYCRGIVKCLGLSYLSCISFRADENGQPKLLEINPRAMGSIHLSAMAGNSLVEKLFSGWGFLSSAAWDGVCSVQPETVPSFPEGVREEPSRCVTRPGFMASLYYDLAAIPAVFWNEISPPVRETYERYYGMISSRITDIVFNCRFAWDRLYHFRWSVIEDCFVQVSYGNRHAPSFMLMPLGKFDTEKLDRIVGIVREDFRRHNKKLTIYGIDENYLSLFEAMKTAHRPAYYNDDFSDYLYDAEELRTLAGRKYSKKRNHLGHFLKAYPDFEYETLAPEHFEECLALVRRWEAEKNVNENDPEESDYLMIKNLTDHWEKLDARGGVIRIGGSIAAFAIGSFSGDTAFIHFEKADAACDGLYTAINKFVLEHEFPGAVYVNREEDLGIPGLRQAKQSYYPISMVKKYKMDIE